jgi:hypothetical protein
MSASMLTFNARTMTARLRVTLPDNKILIATCREFARGNCGRIFYHYTMAIDNVMIFDAHDFSSIPLYNRADRNIIMALIETMHFLTLQYDDTDAEYFDTYTGLQREWCESDNCWYTDNIAMDYEEKYTDMFNKYRV